MSSKARQWAGDQIFRHRQSRSSTFLAEAAILVGRDVSMVVSGHEQRQQLHEKIGQQAKQKGYLSNHSNDTVEITSPNGETHKVEIVLVGEGGSQKDKPLLFDNSAIWILCLFEKKSTTTTILSWISLGGLGLVYYLLGTCTVRGSWSSLVVFGLLLLAHLSISRKFEWKLKTRV